MSTWIHIIGGLFLLILVLGVAVFVGTVVVASVAWVAGLLGHALRVSQDRSHDGVARPRIPASLRKAVIARDGYVCQECGATEELEIDHIVAVSKGGATTLENLQVMCTPCNQAKGNRP